MRSNGAGRFLFCLVITEEAKRFLLIFPQGRGHLGGWPVLMKKLHFLGIVPSSKVRGVVPPVGVRSSPKEGTAFGSFAEAVRKDPGVVGEVVWLQLGEGEMKCREEKLRHWTRYQIFLGQKTL